MDIYNTISDSNIKDDWKERWFEIISKDYDYDGDFIIKILTHKLGLMLDFYNKIDDRSKKANLKADNDINRIIRTVSNCYNLGLKVLTYNYGEEADKIFEEKGNPRWLIESSEEEDYKEWDRLCSEASARRQKDIEKLFRNIGRNIDTWWV